MAFEQEHDPAQLASRLMISHQDQHMAAADCFTTNTKIWSAPKPWVACFFFRQAERKKDVKRHRTSSTEKETKGYLRAEG